MPILTFALGCCICALDWYTKYLCAFLLDGVSEVVVFSFLNFVDVRNKGISFGLFSGYSFSNIFFLFVNTLLIIFILLFSFRERRIALCIAWSCIFGGALGNMFDRLFFGAVRDFIDVHFFGFHWPAFNVADGAIFLGVLVMFFLEWRVFTRERFCNVD